MTHDRALILPQRWHLESETLGATRSRPCIKTADGQWVASLADAALANHIVILHNAHLEAIIVEEVEHVSC